MKNLLFALVLIIILALFDYYRVDERILVINDKVTMTYRGNWNSDYYLKRGDTKIILGNLTSLAFEGNAVFMEGKKKNRIYYVVIIQVESCKRLYIHRADLDYRKDQSDFYGHEAAKDYEKELKTIYNQQKK